MAIVCIDKILKVLADRNRLRILNLLHGRKLCVCELAHVIGIAQPSVSRHLKKLKDAGMIKEIQSGLWTDYALVAGHPAFKVLWKQIQPLLKADAQFVKDLKNLKGADRKILCKT